ncbi:heavy-metal-associated domain-containing protein [Patescibacteria group bacterium]|nr:heavy-metal-associated domain-containing protein [Patescibacteria group bacterium]
MTKKVQFSIEGMHCGSCAAGIKMVLDNTDGVLSASADWDSKNGEVEYDEEKIKLEDILKAIGELGYKATPKS